MIISIDDDYLTKMALSKTALCCYHDEYQTDCYSFDNDNTVLSKTCSLTISIEVDNDGKRTNLTQQPFYYQSVGHGVERRWLFPNCPYATKASGICFLLPIDKLGDRNERDLQPSKTIRRRAGNQGSHWMSSYNSNC